MLSYYQNEGANTFLVVETDAAAISSYETDMLYNNYIEGLIQPEFRALDGALMTCYKTNGLVSLDDCMVRTDMSAARLAALFLGACGVVTELSAYMLSPDGLVLDTDKIYCRGDGERFLFVYVVGREKDVRRELRLLAENLMRKISHRDRAAADFIYGIYEIMLENSYDMSAVRAFAENASKGRAVSEYRTKERRNEENEKLLDEVFSVNPPAQEPPCDDSRDRKACMLCTVAAAAGAVAGVVMAGV